jgi:hypothetical protein
VNPYLFYKFKILISFYTHQKKLVTKGMFEEIEIQKEPKNKATKEQQN